MPPPLTIMGLLQNTWAYSPERVVTWFADSKLRNRKIAMLLFGSRCLTGRRLRKAFGPLCDNIVWENATLIVSGQASGHPPGDPEHVTAAIARIDPDILLVFGKVAADTFLNSERGRYHDCRVIYGPHPANRRKDTPQQLEDMQRELDRVMREMK